MLYYKSFNDLLDPVKTELEITLSQLYQNLKSDNSVVNSVISYILTTGGKHIRPALSLLSSRLFKEHVDSDNIVIAQISEIIHTATLMHDDVIDNANIRRSKQTVSAIWGNNVSVICGDYLLAKASILLASLNNTYIVEIFANVLEEICLGEIQQSSMAFDTSITWDEYILKSTRKTATLFASAMQGAAIVSNASEDEINAVKNFGLNYGLAFQIIDDVLNYFSTNQVGKPSYEDLKAGILTAPVLYAIDEYPDIIPLIASKFENESDFDRAISLINSSSGIRKSTDLAQSYVNKAIKSLDLFPNSQMKLSLTHLAEYVTQRSF